MCKWKIVHTSSLEIVQKKSFGGHGQPHVFSFGELTAALGDGKKRRDEKETGGRKEEQEKEETKG